MHITKNQTNLSVSSVEVYQQFLNLPISHFPLLNLSAASQSVKEKACLTYVHPKLKFASSAWNSYYHCNTIHTCIYWLQNMLHDVEPFQFFGCLSDIKFQLQFEERSYIGLVHKTINSLVCMKPEPY